MNIKIITTESQAILNPKNHGSIGYNRRKVETEIWRAVVPKLKTNILNDLVYNYVYDEEIDHKNDDVVTDKINTISYLHEYIDILINISLTDDQLILIWTKLFTEEIVVNCLYLTGDTKWGPHYHYNFGEYDIISKPNKINQDIWDELTYLTHVKYNINVLYDKILKLSKGNHNLIVYIVQYFKLPPFILYKLSSIINPDDIIHRITDLLQVKAYISGELICEHINQIPYNLLKNILNDRDQQKKGRFSTDQINTMVNKHKSLLYIFIRNKSASKNMICLYKDEISKQSWNFISLNYRFSGKYLDKLVPYINWYLYDFAAKC